MHQLCSNTQHLIVVCICMREKLSESDGRSHILLLQQTAMIPPYVVFNVIKEEHSDVWLK